MSISQDLQLNKDVIFSNDSDLQNKVFGGSKGLQGDPILSISYRFWGSLAKWPVGATVPEGWRRQLGEIINPALKVMLSKRNSMVNSSWDFQKDSGTYPEIRNANFKGTLWTFENN